MKSLKYLMTMSVLFLSIVSFAQIKNSQVKTVAIHGNCGMCKSNIEKAGNVKGIAKVEWDRKSQLAQITYDPSKTTEEEILKRIALAGYDNEKYLAPTEVYEGLEACCQYERSNKTESEITHEHAHAGDDTHSGTRGEKVDAKSFSKALETYFRLKDALVESNVEQSVLYSKELHTIFSSIKMQELSKEEHQTWMKLKDGLMTDALQISKSDKIDFQRKSFVSLSVNMYALLQSSSYAGTVYYQRCPMYDDGKGATWLSTSAQVKNPYYGSMMLSCGKTIDTIQ